MLFCTAVVVVVVVGCWVLKSFRVGDYVPRHPKPCCEGLCLDSHCLPSPSTLLVVPQYPTFTFFGSYNLVVILKFYLLFPWLMGDVSFRTPKEPLKKKKAANPIARNSEEPPFTKAHESLNPNP